MQIYDDVIDTILGDLRPPGGDPRVNALRGGPPPSFAAGAGMPPPPGQPGPGGPSFAQASGMPMPPPGGPMAGPGGPPPGQTPPKPPGGLPGAPGGLPKATGKPPQGQPQPPMGGVPQGQLGAPGSVLPLPPASPIDPLLAQADDLYARHKLALDEQANTYKPIDRAAMQEVYAKRGDTSDRNTMLALAAQQAGDQFQPMQAHFLKQAAAAKEPMKMTGGVMTAEGFVEDPGHEAEQAAKRSDAKVKAIEAALAQNLTAQERRRLEIVHQQEKVRHDQMLLALGQMRAGSGADGRQARIDQGNWRIEDSLSKQFDGIVKPYVEEMDATKKLTSIAAGKRPNAIEQQSMMVLLNKFLDPGSVVREGEFARVAQAQGWLDRASNLIDQVAKGEPLSNDLIRDIRGMASLYEKAATSKIQMVGDEYAAKAYRRGLDPTSIVVNPYYKHTETGTPVSGARGAPGPSQAVRVNSPAEAAKLKPGTPFITPDGQTRVRQ